MLGRIQVGETHAGAAESIHVDQQPVTITRSKRPGRALRGKRAPALRCRPRRFLRRPDPPPTAALSSERTTRIPTPHISSPSGNSIACRSPYQELSCDSRWPTKCHPKQENLVMKQHERSPEEGIVTYGRQFAATLTAIATATGSSGAAAALPALGSIGLLAPQFGIAAAIPVLPVAIGIGVAAGGVAILAARGKNRKGKKRRKR